jgi:UDP-glucose 4-epimerase
MRPDVDYVFLFGSPSSNHWFNYALSYSVRETVENFMNALDFCQTNDIKLIYPSSATIYEGTTSYAKTKKILELLADIHTVRSLGLRIFAGYGVGEEHKKEYCSTVYSFTKEMMAGKRPVIWGDGEQTRDWIYIDDIVDNIIKLKDKVGTVDIGTGSNYSMNEVVAIINDAMGTHIKPKYVPKPNSYIDKTICNNPIIYNTTLFEGVRKIIKSLKVY